VQNICNKMEVRGKPLWHSLTVRIEACGQNALQAVMLSCLMFGNTMRQFWKVIIHNHFDDRLWLRYCIFQWSNQHLRCCVRKQIRSKSNHLHWFALWEAASLSFMTYNKTQNNV